MKLGGLCSLFWLGLGSATCGLWVYVSPLFGWLVGSLLLFLVLGMWVWCLESSGECLCFCSVFRSVSPLLCFWWAGATWSWVFHVYCLYLEEFLDPCDELLSMWLYVTTTSLLKGVSIKSKSVSFGVSKSIVATALVLLPSFCSFVASFLTLGFSHSLCLLLWRRSGGGLAAVSRSTFWSCWCWWRLWMLLRY